jgi:hypothetical protein
MTPQSNTEEILKRKRDSLNQVVEPWLDSVRGDREGFRRMTSQTAAVVNLLDSLLEKIDSDLGDYSGDPQPLENRILAAWQFWHGYREKFTQRETPVYEQFLRAADELAWVCYVPARTAALAPDDPACKEPPLVYFSSEASPFVDPRATRYQPDGVPARLIQAYGWPEAASKLPFALIGVPWFQLGFLPGGLAIAHEVGHSVESDFGIGPELAKAIVAAGVSEPTSHHWFRWRGEMFADLWGCLALGPAFVASLSDILLPRQRGNPDISLLGEYPPAVLRVWWNIQVLEELQFGKAGSDYTDSVWSLWQNAKAAAGIGDPLWDESRMIAAKWLTSSFAAFLGKKLGQILCFSEDNFRAASEQAQRALQSRACGHGDIRVLWASIQMAFVVEATQQLLQEILRACSNAPRAVPATFSPAARAAYVRKMAREII